MRKEDMKIGQRVRCVFDHSRNGKTGTLTSASPIIVEWDDGCKTDTSWSYASSFELLEEASSTAKPNPNNVCCVCGYRDKFIASSTPACRVCAPKISLDHNLTRYGTEITPERIAQENQKSIAWGGNGFGSAFDPSITKIKEQFTKLQDRSQYQPGDRIQVRINNGEDRWATIAIKNSSNDCLLYLDEGYDDGFYSSFATIEAQRAETIQALGLDPKAKNLFWWGNFRTPITIVVLHREPANEKPMSKNLPSQDRLQYQPGDRIKVQLKGWDKAVWAIVIDHNNNGKTAIYLDEPYAKSWASDDLTRLDVASSFGLDPKASNFLWWRKSADVFASKTAFTDEEITVLEYQPLAVNLKVGDTVQYVAQNEVVGDNPPLEKGQQYKVRKVIKRKDRDIQVFLEDFPDDKSWWRSFRFQRISEGERKLRYLIGDRVEIKIDGAKILWGTIVGCQNDSEGVERPIVYLDRADRGYGGNATNFSVTKKALDAAVQDLGLGEPTSKFWFASSAHTEILQVVSKHKVRFKPGDIVSYIDNGGLTNKKHYRVSKVEPANNPENDHVEIEGEPSSSFWWASRFRMVLPAEEVLAQKVPQEVPANFTVAAQSGENVKNTDGGSFSFKVNLPKELPAIKMDVGSGTPPLAFQFKDDNWVISSATPITINNLKLDWEKLAKDLAENFARLSHPEPQPVEPTFGSMIKEDVISAGYRVVATQLTKGTKAALLKLMQDRGADNNKIALLQEILETEAGNVLIAMILGMSLTYIPMFNQDRRAQKLANEFRVGSLAITGNALMDLVWGYVKNLPQEKVRVDTQEARIAEEIVEEEEENEAGSSDARSA
jgi:hypothetical protein